MPTLLNTLATEDQLANSPSRRDGIPPHLEDELRVYGCQLIQQAGVLLDLPQRTMATAQVLYQRFWFVSSFKHFCLKDICMGSLFLSTKLEETPSRLRDVINVFDFLFQRALHFSKNKPAQELGNTRRNLGAWREDLAGHDQNLISNSNGRLSPGFEASDFTYAPRSYFSQAFYDSKDAIVISEMQILKRLGFNVQVNLPFATMVNYLQLLGLAEEVVFISQQPVAGLGQGRDASADDHDSRKKVGFAQRAWSFLNDALQTPVYCLFAPHVLACSAIYLTAMTSEPPLSLPLWPEPWWRLFDVSRAELRVVSAHILRLYSEDGPAGRVKERWGGLAELAEKSAVRKWLEGRETSERGEGMIQRF
ncbi:cyclin-like protein [Violaceomyces palustris]|uniref:Cyclin-like protein n=1 Tax=Violaceomyces palustris TaxID=1673888 RepID=A0ACD0NV22_9BASI|nr:cyclin-like protein [Violaceomyces palustris]